jgi:hypothetical protein
LSCSDGNPVDPSETEKKTVISIIYQAASEPPH